LNDLDSSEDDKDRSRSKRRRLSYDEAVNTETSGKVDELKSNSETILLEKGSLKEIVILESSPPTKRLSPTRKPLFGSLRRAKATTIRTKYNPTTLETTSDTSDKQSPTSQLTQTQLDLGTKSVFTHCSVCGMNWVKTSPEDVSMHKRFHLDSERGIQLPKPNRAFSKKIWESAKLNAAGKRDYVSVITRDGVSWEQKIANKLLKNVNAELGAADMDMIATWSDKSTTQCVFPSCDWAGDEATHRTHVLRSHKDDMEKLKPKSTSTDGLSCPAHNCVFNDEGCKPLFTPEELTDHLKFHTTPKSGAKIFIYVCDQSVVAVLLAVPISYAFPVTSLSPLQLMDTPRRAILGIERVWTARRYRRQGIGQVLLRVVQKNWEHGFVIEKAHIAWSCTTEAGGKLADAWWADQGKENRWSMYKEG
jgi:N-acetyltransferase